MRFTVGEMLAMPALKGAELVAGASGLDRVITSVNFMEVPDIARYIKPDELLLTTTYPIKDDKLAQRNLVRVLSDAKVAALAIKPVFYGNTVPQEMLDAAEELGFPLIQLPETASFNEIINPVLEEVLNQHVSALRRSEATHRALTDLVLGGGGLQEIARMLANIQGRPISIHSENWSLVALAYPDEFPLANEEQYRAMIEQAARDLRQKMEVPADAALDIDWGGGAVKLRVHPVTVARETFAHIVTWDCHADTGQLDIAALEQGATVVALEMTKLRAVATVEQRFRSYFIEDIIQGRIESRHDAISRGATYGWDLKAPFVPMLLEIDGFRRFYRQSSPAPAQVLRRLWNAVSVATSVFAGGCIVVDRGTRIMALLRADATEQGGVFSTPHDLVKMINTELAPQGNLTVSAGLGGRMTDIMELGRALEEATTALEIGPLVNGPGAVTTYNELGFYKVLFSHKGRGELMQFSQDTLKVLQDSDKKTNSELVRTLEAVLKCNGNLKEAARELYVHYNTLRYRVNRIRELTALDIGTTQGMLSLQLALMIQRIHRSPNAE